MFHAATILFPFVVIMLVGATLPRIGVLDAGAVRGLGDLVLGIEIPALLFRSLATQDLRQGFDFSITLAYFGGCLVVMAFALLLARKPLGLGPSQSGVFGLSAVYSNSSLLGVPIIQGVFGAHGVALLGKIIAFHSLLLLPLGTLIVVLGRHDGVPVLNAVARAAGDTIRNPIILGLLGGAAWSLTGLGLAAPAERVTGLLADAATPTALLALGAMQVRLSWRQAREALASVSLKLALHPLVVCLVALGITAAGIGHLTPEAVAVATITASLPAGMNVYLLARQYDCYVAQATAATTLGTLLSIISIGLALQINVSHATPPSGQRGDGSQVQGLANVAP